jgi:hypothetical protein
MKSSVKVSRKLGCIVTTFGALVTAFGPWHSATAASLDAYAGIVAGAGNSSIANGCTTFGPPSELSSFFTFSGPSIPLGGIGACGYVGGIDHLTATSGTLTNSKSQGPVILGNPGYSGYYAGTANSTASYGSLGASAQGNFTGGLPGSPVALYQGAGAAKFSDTLTATSPLVANASAGFVRYQFSVHGSEAALGAQMPYFFGETYTVLDIQQQNGPVYEILNAHTSRGSTGTISNSPPPAGWVAGTGSLSGSSTFYSLALPMNWGQAWDVKVGLLAWAYGQADANFLSTAKLTGVQLFDANHAPITQFTLTSASGTNYINAVPEPETYAMLMAGLGLLGFMVRRKKSA